MSHLQAPPHVPRLVGTQPRQQVSNRSAAAVGRLIPGTTAARPIRVRGCPMWTHRVAVTWLVRTVIVHEILEVVTNSSSVGRSVRPAWWTKGGSPMKKVSGAASFLVAVMILAVVTAGVPSAGAQSSGTTVVKIGIFTPASGNPTGVNYVRSFKALQAALTAFNKRGVPGHKGLKFQAVTCDTKEDANVVRQCASQMVSAGVVATVNSFTTLWPQVQSTFEDAHIPQIAIATLDFGQFSSPVSFPTTNIIGDYAAQSIEFAKVNLSFIVTATTENPAAQVIPIAVKAGVSVAGGKAVGSGVINISAGSVNWQGAVQSAVDAHADSVIFGLPADAVVQYVQAAEQLGGNFKYGYTTAFSAANLKQMGPKALSRMYLESTYPPVSATKEYPAIKQFVSDMKAGGAVVDVQTLATWFGVLVVDKLIAAMPAGATIDASAILKALQTTQNLQTGIIPPWSPGSSVVKGADGQPFAPLKQVSDDYFYFIKYKGTTEVLLQKDPISPAASGVNYFKALTGG